MFVSANRAITCSDSGGSVSDASSRGIEPFSLSKSGNFLSAWLLWFDSTQSSSGTPMDSWTHE
jgi:hypothetical protein